jgi:hypothetical protein
MMMFQVAKLPNEDVTVCHVASKKWSFGANCGGIACSSALKDLASLWRDDASVDETNFFAANLEYTIGWQGDSRASENLVKFDDSALLSTYTLAEAGTFGTDIDVRRFIPLNGAPCGASWSQGGRCIRNFAATPDTKSPSSRTEKHWIFGAIGSGGPGGGPYINMVRCKVYLDTDGSVKITAVDAAQGYSGLASQHPAKSKLNHYDYDIYGTPEPIAELFAKYKAAPPKGTVPIAPTVSSTGIGIGAIKYLIAPEMISSLAETKEPRLNDAEAEAEAEASLGQTPSVRSALNNYLTDYQCQDKCAELKDVLAMKVEADSDELTCQQFQAISHSDSCIQKKCACVEKTEIGYAVDFFCAQKGTVTAFEAKTYDDSIEAELRDKCPMEAGFMYDN